MSADPAFKRCDGQLEPQIDAIRPAPEAAPRPPAEVIFHPSMPDFVRRRRFRGAAPSQGYLAGKALFDVAMGLLALPLILVVAACLLLLNPLFNPGPLFFRQERLGQGQVPFFLVKFRTMAPAGPDLRGVMERVEAHRIPPLGRVLRVLRIDELPNFFNVLRGEMSTIGPRPDAVAHADVFLEAIPHYHHRFRVKPGITGLAQVVSGYAEGVEATAVKAHYDRLYVENQSAGLEAQIVLRTMRVILSGVGAK